jgi:glycosyltransferase involved in cell wall biosynthesis
VASAEESRAAQAAPNVSIGLAVFNGEEFLEQTIQSILDQTYPDFELVISDNASTDGTVDIIGRFASIDPRIHYSRNASNIGGARNHNLAVTLSRGKYFRWAAHDDYLEPEMLERCVAILERDPEVVLCYTQVRELDLVKGSEQIVSRNNAYSPRPATRFRRIILSKEFLEEGYGLIRRDVLNRTRLQADYVASDRTLMAELSLYGRFHEIAEPLFVKRLHERNAYVDWRTRTAWFNPDAPPKVSFPWWSQFADLINTVRRAQIGPPVKIECYASVGLWAIQRSPNLAKDLAFGAYAWCRGKSWLEGRFESTRNWD